MNVSQELINARIPWNPAKNTVTSPVFEELK
jgi:hypothetical protein